MKSFLAFSVLLAVLSVAHATQDQTTTADVPHLPPLSATAFVCDTGAKRQVVAMVATYSNGKILRWDAWHMHGFTVQQLIVYHDSAPDSKLYIVPCKAPEIT